MSTEIVLSWLNVFVVSRIDVPIHQSARDLSELSVLVTLESTALACDTC